MKNKYELISKVFDNIEVRTVWDEEQEKYYISVVDIVKVLTDSVNPRHYWNVLKGRLKNEGNESVTNCDQLKLKSSDGKYYKTDVVDIEGIFRIIESIPSKKAEPIKQWLARLGSERIDETIDPSLSIKRSIEIYRKKGYSDEWISKRVNDVLCRKKLTDVWNELGIKEDVEYAILTNEIYKEWSGFTAKEYKKYKGLHKESLKDNMTDIELALSNLGEAATKELVIEKLPIGLDENKKVAKIGASAAKAARDVIESNLNKPIITKKQNKHK